METNGEHQLDQKKNKQNSEYEQNINKILKYARDIKY